MEMHVVCQVPGGTVPGRAEGLGRVHGHAGWRGGSGAGPKPVVALGERPRCMPS